MPKKIYFEFFCFKRNFLLYILRCYHIIYCHLKNKYRILKIILYKNTFQTSKCTVKISENERKKYRCCLNFIHKVGRILKPIKLEKIISKSCVPKKLFIALIKGNFG
ncbi:hypothetical protein EDEG_01584 [Edhazardia aedis USNM 41457]|uniref:Uncharacterized protein n=1 Tax=Edhazardia aedis (strain USNM 41457) TaxID=1003232 RepID=J8ZWV6_EDHAE|nr:hypothetical protein EDEG_01584 [Edhazardia aedis USNM 41457]|eukprot:EJW04148.1 hypothetical protein EDEG_01584 [Edhazardia aedis USNM 41457]